MKFFLDTANIDEIRDAASTGVLDGVTTNPTLISKEGNTFEDQLLKICSLVNGPVSAETVSRDAAGMIEEGRPLWRRYLHHACENIRSTAEASAHGQRSRAVPERLGKGSCN